MDLLDHLVDTTGQRHSRNGRLWNIGPIAGSFRLNAGGLDHFGITNVSSKPDMRHVDRISEARRERRVMADGIVPAIIWVVLFGGAFLTIGFTFFFGAENLRAQSLMTGALSILIFAGLLTVVEIDHPFARTGGSCSRG